MFYGEGSSVIGTVRRREATDANGTITISYEATFTLYDMRGSVTSIVARDGSLAKGYEYDEYGNIQEKSEIVPNSRT